VGSGRGTRGALGQYLSRRGDPGKTRAFHEAMPLVEGIGMLTRKEQIADRFAFVACNRCELARPVAGVATTRQRVRLPVLEMDE